MNYFINCLIINRIKFTLKYIFLYEKCFLSLQIRYIYKSIYVFMIRCKKGKCIVYSKKGKHLSKPMSKKKAKSRLREIEYFKHKR
jgi:hypothetical protein